MTKSGENLLLNLDRTQKPDFRSCVPVVPVATGSGRIIYYHYMTNLSHLVRKCNCKSLLTLLFLVGGARRPRRHPAGTSGRKFRVGPGLTDKMRVIYDPLRVVSEPFY